MMVLRTFSLMIVAAFTLMSCSATEPVVGGYEIMLADHGKAWLQDPDGATVHAGTLKQVFHDGRHILLVAKAARYEDMAQDELQPIDQGTCHIALLIDTATREIVQISVSDANRRARFMTEDYRSARECVNSELAPAEPVG